MEPAATNPGPVDSAKRHYLRPFVLRAVWAAIVTGAFAIVLLLLLFLVMEPAGDLLRVLDDRLTLKAWLIVFWVGAGATLAGVLMSGMIAAARVADLFGPDSARGAKAELGWLRSTRVWTAMALVVFLAALAMPLRTVTDEPTFYEMLPHNTPAETIQFFLYLISGGIAVTLLFNHRAIAEIQRTLLGNDAAERKAAFEVLMPQAKATFSSQPIGAPAVAAEATPSVPDEPAPDPIMALPIASPAVVVAYPTAGSLQAMTGSADTGESRTSDRVFAVVLLMALGLTISHLWLLYAVRGRLKETDMWERTYMHFSSVPQDPRDSTATTPPYPQRYNVPRRAGWNTSSLPKKNEPLAGLAGVTILGGSFLNMALQATVALWGILCIISGRRLRTFGQVVAWLMLLTIAVSALANVYLAQQFKFSPDQLAELTFFRNLSDGEFREISQLMSPMDVSLRQIVIPLAMLAALSERAGLMWKARRR
jgi:hypothetical protein